MALTYEYLDQVLSPLITEAREELAAADVDAIATFPDAWRDRLIVLRVYIITCLDYASANDDPFTLKLGQYRAQYDEALTEARKTVSSTVTVGLFSVPLERA